MRTRITKEEAESAKEGDGFLVTIKEECDICGYKQYGGILLVKIPEMHYQCISCAENYPDNLSKGWCVYVIGEGFIT